MTELGLQVSATVTIDHLVDFIDLRDWDTEERIVLVLARLAVVRRVADFVVDVRVVVRAVEIDVARRSFEPLADRDERLGEVLLPRASYPTPALMLGSYARRTITAIAMSRMQRSAVLSFFMSSPSACVS
jgi:hypothetical protein